MANSSLTFPDSEPTVDELIKHVAEKTGLPPDQAKAAAEHVLGFVKQKLPEPLRGHLDQFLSGGGTPNLGDVAKNIGGLFGHQG